MSRHPSPGPSQHTHSHTQMFHQIPLNTSAKLKGKPYVPGITAGAEDVKYQAKYKELKKKVKEIESDNDRLYLKLLLSKKNIRRMNLERAILYERLAQVPPTPGRHNQELPNETDPMFVQQPAEPPRPNEIDERTLEDYLRSNPNARVIHGPDGRIIAIEDPSAHTRGALGLVGPPPPQGVPVVRGYGYESGAAPAGYEADRQGHPPIPAIREPPQPHDSRAPNNRDRSPVYHAEAIRQTQSHQSHSHSHSHSHSSSHRSRGSSSRHDLDPSQGDLGRLDTLPPAHGHVPVHSRSPSLSGDGQVEPRPRHHDIHELTTQHGHAIPHARAEIPASNLPPSPEAPHSPTHGRFHNHQRIGPGVHLHRQQERDPEMTRRLLLEREKEKERDREREIEYQRRRAAEEEELRLLPSWTRDELPLLGPGVSRTRSRSDTPASGGAGGGGLSRPDSGQSFERERRPYAAPRVANLLTAPRDSFYDARDDRMGHTVSHSRGYPPEYASESSRKRSRHDMEIDEDRGGEMLRSPLDGGSRSVGSADSYQLSHDLRGPKRVHPDDDEDMPRGHVSSVRDEKLMDQDD